LQVIKKVSCQIGLVPSVKNLPPCADVSWELRSLCCSQVAFYIRTGFLRSVFFGVSMPEPICTNFFMRFIMWFK
jgi:hypothetical protein